MTDDAVPSIARGSADGNERYVGLGGSGAPTAANAQVNLLPATDVHPRAVAICLGVPAYLVPALWITFGGRETVLDLAIVTLIFVSLYGLIAACSAYSRDVEPNRSQTRSFGDFLRGTVDIESGPIPGWDAFIEIIALPVTLAIGWTIIMICYALA